MLTPNLLPKVPGTLSRYLANASQGVQSMSNRGISGAPLVKPGKNWTDPIKHCGHQGVFKMFETILRNLEQNVNCGNLGETLVKPQYHLRDTLCNLRTTWVNLRPFLVIWGLRSIKEVQD